MFSVIARPFRPVPHRALVDDLDIGVGIEGLVQSLVAGLAGLVGQVTLEIEDLALAADLLGDELAASRAAATLSVWTRLMKSPPAGAVSTAITGMPAVLAASMPGTMPAASTVPRMMPSYCCVTAVSI